MLVLISWLSANIYRCSHQPGEKSIEHKVLRALNPKGGKKLLKLQELDLSMQLWLWR